MLAKIFRNLWKVVIIISIIGGAISTYSIFTSTNDYSLTIIKKSEEKLIERNKTINGLTVAFQGTQLDALYSTQIELINIGKRALTKEYIFQPITITSKNNAKILQVIPEQKEVKISGNSIIFSWELLNPGDKIKTTILSSEPIDSQITYRIKEVPHIDYIDELINPPRTERLKAISVLWLIVAIISIFSTMDAITVIRRDWKLQAIVDLPKTAIAGLTMAADFLGRLSELYKQYYESTPRLLITPEEFDEKIHASVSTSGYMNESDIKFLQDSIIDTAVHSNAYFIRSINIVMGPLLFGFCIVRVLAALI